MAETAFIKVVSHNGVGAPDRVKEVEIRYDKDKFPTQKSLEKYIKGVIKNNYSHFLIARKVEISIPTNNNEVGIILKAKAKKIEVIEPITVDIYW